MISEKFIEMCEMKTRSYKIKSEIVSITVENYIWSCLDEIAEGNDMSTAEFINHISVTRCVGDFSQAMREICIESYRGNLSRNESPLMFQATESPFIYIQ